ncbi:MAG: molybdopterin-dependent oxidoreductase [Actinomycetota bacterium]|nr:molybdopterin-dependent oxidoreductase [Actinomycetota bacterium]
METSRTRDAFAGAAAAALALGVSELLAGLFSGLPSLVEGLGSWVIDNVPKPVKDFAIEVFGTYDKLALLIGIALVTILIGAVVGVFSRERFGIAIGAFVGFGVIASWAGAWNGGVGIGVAAIPGGAAALTGLMSLRWLYGLGQKAPSEEGSDPSRRHFILGAGALVGLAALTGVVGRSLVEKAKMAVSGRSEVVLPVPAEKLPAVPAAAELGIDGLSPVIVPNADFYRIDTAFSVPRVDLQDWTLTVRGLVERPYTIDYFDLLDMRTIERDVTLSCVSNDVGEGLVGNARWQGVPLTEILDRAGVQDNAEQIVGRSVDDFTVGFPVEAAYDGREALVAVGMNGEPLPFEHGFPARLVVAGLYGYVSATKWLSEIVLTGWDEFNAYWIPRGWSKEAPIKTQSRVDTPRRNEVIPPGPRSVAGVAWAPSRGIEKVEVQLGDDAGWVEAELSEALSENSWVQWRVDWDVPIGAHHIRVRATDGTGETQTEEIRPPAPDGATGWHTISVFAQEA